MSEQKATWGQLVRAARKSKKLSLEAVAGELGISLGFLSEMERGKKLPSGDYEFHVTVSKETGAPLEELLAAAATERGELVNKVRVQQLPGLIQALGG